MAQLSAQGCECPINSRACALIWGFTVGLKLFFKNCSNFSDLFLKIKEFAWICNSHMIFWKTFLNQLFNNLIILPLIECNSSSKFSWKFSYISNNIIWILDLRAKCCLWKICFSKSSIIGIMTKQILKVPHEQKCVWILPTDISQWLNRKTNFQNII